MRHIRNFAIIAHIDHGKSTLADRLLELTGVVDPKKHEEQLLDRNPISRERGITIKLAPVHMEYKLGDILYELNLIDTPGHVDFSYEVERTLACVEGVVLLVDATKGIQAQIIKAINEGQPWAIKFFAATQMRDRGYGDRLDHGGSVELTIPFMQRRGDLPVQK